MAVAAAALTVVAGLLMAWHRTRQPADGALVATRGDGLACQAPDFGLVVECRANLRKLFVALDLYSADHDGQFPPGPAVAAFELLHRQGYLEDFDVLICPATRERGVPARKLSLPLSDDAVSYIYRGGSRGPDGGYGAVCWDKADNHRGSERGTVNILNHAGVVAALRETNGDGLGCQASDLGLVVECKANLKRIFVALDLYSADYDDQFPPGPAAAAFELLHRQGYLEDLGVLICPATRERGVPARKLSLPLHDDIVSYMYGGGSRGSDYGHTVVCWDKAGNHKGSEKGTVNVLYNVGGVEALRDR